VDHRTDIWALGVILHEAISGEPPFLGNSIPEISAKILLEEPKPLSEVRATVPKALSELVLRALQKQPDKRFANVSELALALLPFAPTRARGNAERISRVLEAAGMAKSGFQASVPPPQSSPELAAPASTSGLQPVAPRSALPSDNPGKRKQTLANFGQTHSDPIPGVTRGNSRLLVGAGAAAVAGIALIVTLVLKLGGNPEAGNATALQPPAASAAAAPPPAEPVPSPPQLTAAATPAAPEPKVAVASAEAAPSEAEHVEPKAPSSVPARHKAAARANTASKKPLVAARATAVAKPTESSHSVDFKSKFGSRK
jgi:serine/threonine-protein kinase